jgi:hypothetical protein
MERRALTRRLVRIPGGRTGASSRRVLDDALQSSSDGTRRFERRRHGLYSTCKSMHGWFCVLLAHEPVRVRTCVLTSRSVCVREDIGAAFMRASDFRSLLSDIDYILVANG